MATAERQGFGSPPPARRERGAAWLLLVTAATLLLFAANSLLCRGALARGRIDPVAFTAVRVASGAAALALVTSVRRCGLRGGSAASGLALFLYAALFSLAYVRIPAAVGALLLFPAVQATMIGWAVARGARPARRQWAGMGLALAGLAYLAAPGVGRPDLSGAAAMVGAGVAWGVYSLRARAAADPIATTAGNFAWALPFAAAFAALWPGARATTPDGLLLALLSGAVASGGGYCLWYLALPRLGVTRAGAVQLAVPIAAALAAVAFLGEPLVLRVVVAGGVILAGLSLVVLRR